MKKTKFYGYPSWSCPRKKLTYILTGKQYSKKHLVSYEDCGDQPWSPMSNLVFASQNIVESIETRMTLNIKPKQMKSHFRGYKDKANHIGYGGIMTEVPTNFIRARKVIQFQLPTMILMDKKTDNYTHLKTNCCIQFRMVAFSLDCPR